MSAQLENASMTTSHRSNGARLVSADQRALPLRGTALYVTARGGVARVVLKQRFYNSYDVPLSVSYQVPLPQEAAVCGFAFEVAGRRVVGEVDTKEAARERFEDAILSGHTAALLEQDRSSLFEQAVGNVPAHTELVCELVVDQKLLWLADLGGWEWRFPTVVAPRYLGAEGQVADAERVSVEVLDGPLDARADVDLVIGDTLVGVPSSPTHALAAAGHEVRLRGAPLDRDLVFRWAVATHTTGVSLSSGRRAHDELSHGLITVVPPTIQARGDAVPRDLILLIDTSGSMGGEPLTQAQRVLTALVHSLSDRDQLEMIEFSSSARRWNRTAAPATDANRRKAAAWIAGLRASGATDMHTGILAALAPLRDEAQRQIVVITDGLIGFEWQIVGEILERLPRGSRVHTLGVGHGVNRSLTGPAARAGGGVELICAPGEDAEPIAQRLLARTNAPLVVDLALSGTALVQEAPARLPDLFGGAPALVSVSLRPEGGSLMVRGRTAIGSFEHTLFVPAHEPGTGEERMAGLWAREHVEDLEAQRAASTERAPLDAAIERIGLAYQIATRMTSWVAVSDQPDVDPTEPTRQVRMPHALAAGLSAEGVGLRAAAPLGSQMRTQAIDFSDYTPAPAAPRMTRTRAGSARFKTRSAFERPMAEAGEADDFFMSMDEGSEPMSLAAPAGPDRGEPVTRWRGRIRRLRGRTLIVEIDVPVSMVWTRGKLVTLVWPDGTRVEATISRLRSTRSGQLKAGQSVRLVVKLPSELASAPAMLFLQADDIEVELS